MLWRTPLSFNIFWYDRIWYCQPWSEWRINWVLSGIFWKALLSISVTGWKLGLLERVKLTISLLNKSMVLKSFSPVFSKAPYFPFQHRIAYPISSGCFRNTFSCLYCFYCCDLLFLAMLAHNKTAPFLLVVSNFWGAVHNRMFLYLFQKIYRQRTLGIKGGLWSVHALTIMVRFWVLQDVLKIQFHRINIEEFPF